MLHDADTGILSGDSPDVPTAPTMDLMDNYTHLNNVSHHPSSMPTEEALNATQPQWQRQQQVLGPLLDPKAGQNQYTKGALFQKHPSPSNYPAPQPLETQPPMSFSPTRLLTENKPTSDPLQTEAQDQDAEQQWKQRVAKVYSDNTVPFRYTEGYHILLKYVTQKFEKEDVLRIVRALAIFRPSLIALQMPLSEEDETFVERAFQRTILEFEKLISFSGTPTVVWRRTCEICLVGAEFCMLTQWSKEDVMGNYIYQFMDKESVLNYW